MRGTLARTSTAIPGLLGAHVKRRPDHDPGLGHVKFGRPRRLGDAEVNEVLNLNLPWLMNNRKAILTAFQGRLERGQFSRPSLEKLLRKWNGESDTGDLEPFCQVVVYWLRKRLARI